MKSLQLLIPFRDLDSFIFFLKEFFAEASHTLKYMLGHPYWSILLVLICINLWRDIFRSDEDEYYYDYGFDDDTENPPDPPELP